MAFMRMSSSSTYQGVPWNQTVPWNHTDREHMMFDFVDNCICSDGGKLYNLAPLQRRDGKPRFTVQGSHEYEFSYNPCSSFSLGPPQSSDCFGDVAICMFTENQAMYQNIGRQSTERCGYDTKTMTPQFEYTNTDKFPQWKAIVKLKCDPTRRRVEEAKFEVIEDDHSPRIFLLIHNCACPDGCRPGDDQEPDKNQDPTTDDPASSSTHDLEYSLIGAFSSLVIVVPLVIWGFIKIKNKGNDENRQLLNEEHNRVDDYAANHSSLPNQDINIKGGKHHNAANLVKNV